MQSQDILSGQSDRSVSNEDLELILKNANREGHFSPLDFKNCNTEDLRELAKIAEAQMEAVPSAQWEEVKRKTKLFTTVTLSLTDRMKEEADQLRARSVTLQEKLSSLGTEVDEILARINTRDVQLSGIVADAEKAIRNNDAAIKDTIKTIEGVDALLAEGRPAQGTES